MEGATSSKKRKICHDDEVEEEDEEQKIDKFFALIKSIREAREHLINSSNKIALNSQRKKSNVAEEEKKQIAVWKPSFQHEDFLEEGVASEFKKPPVTVTLVGSSQREGGADDQKGNDKESLDLRLSL